MTIYLGSLVIILIATTISASDISPALIEECRKIGEVARFGGDYDCDKWCDKPPRQICHHIGMTRCFCPEGKVRITYRGRCIPPSECPARNGQKFRSNTFNRDISPALIEECRKKGEVARWGGEERCDDACDNPRRQWCHRIRALRCFCPEGKVRITYLGGRCIPPSECPARNGKKFRSNTFNSDVSPALIENCRKKGEVARFGPDEDCDETCEGSPRTCTLIGMFRCFCPNGKVRITNRGRCIPPSECPARNGQKFRSNTFKRGKWPSKNEAVSDPPKPGPMLIEECRKKGEVAKWGEPKCCDETCVGKKFCPNMLGTLRCFCPEGKVRFKLGGRCIPRSQCQEQTGQKWR